MDPNHDNPFIRFSAFWLGLGIVLIFALLLAVITLFNREKADDLEELAAAKRYETRASVEAAQAEELSQEAIEAAVAKVAKDLVGSKEVAVEKPEWVVPGSATAQKLADAPPVDTTAVDQQPTDAGPVDPAVMEMGKAQYMVCAACHGDNGEGKLMAGPPLAKSEWVTGPVSNLIRIQLRGLKGEITVAGKTYTEKDFPVGMLHMSYQTDEQIAAVLTYVRNSFGNKASAVKPEQVEALRSEVGKPQLTVKDLIQP